jgi:hypothetical protein
MKIKTAEATGPALDWLVAKCVGTSVRWSAPHEQLLINGHNYLVWEPTRDPAQAWPIINRMRNVSISHHANDDPAWTVSFDGMRHLAAFMRGPTGLIAAMRCWVISQMGDEVEIPEELV